MKKRGLNELFDRANTRGADDFTVDMIIRNRRVQVALYSIKLLLCEF
jgi:hypothetical protein